MRKMRRRILIPERFDTKRDNLLVVSDVKRYVEGKLESLGSTEEAPSAKTIVIYQGRKPTTKNTKYIAIQDAIPPYVSGTYPSSTAIRYPPRDLVFISMQTAEHLFDFRKGKITDTKSWGTY